MLDQGDLMLDTTDLTTACDRARDGQWFNRLSIGASRVVYLLRDGHGGILLLDTPQSGAWGWRYDSWHEAGFLLMRLYVVLDGDGYEVTLDRGPAYSPALEPAL